MPEKIGYYLNFEADNRISEHGIPYREVTISSFCDEPGLDVTIRRYPKRTFVAYEDNRNNQSGGHDIDDCWLAPTIIVGKIPNGEFDLSQALSKVAIIVGLNHIWPTYQEIVVGKIKSLLGNKL